MNEMKKKNTIITRIKWNKIWEDWNIIINDDDDENERYKEREFEW
jgi:hypothetical protein